jgi:hypothetical protein
VGWKVGGGSGEGGRVGGAEKQRARRRTRLPRAIKDHKTTLRRPDRKSSFCKVAESKLV